MQQGTIGRPITPQQSFAYLSSTNLVYRDELPPEYRLPTLLGREQPNLRGLNRIDNEEQIPDVDFREALRKFEVEPKELENLKQGIIRKTFSENEMYNYDQTFGRKLPYNKSSTTNLITDWSSYYANTREEEEKRAAQFYKAKLNDGVSDEYIPNFSSFNLAKFEIDESDTEMKNANQESRGMKKKPRAVSISAGNSDVSLKVEAIHPEIIVKPIKIDFSNKTISRNDKPEEEYFQVSAESFKIADSPERHTDRLVLSSIPKNFQSFSFSYRKKMLAELLPESLRDDVEYKNHITKILRKNSTSASSLGSMASVFAPIKHRKKVIKPDSNEMGSVLMSTWKLGRVFNNGSFGIIRECFNVDNLDDVKAVKIIPINRNLKTFRKFQSEMFMWSKLNHNLVVPFLDVQITCENIFLLMPLLNEGTLFDRVKYWEANKISICERQKHIEQYVRSMIEAIAFLHQHGIHHGDVKLENFLLQNNIPRICDFGMTNYDLDSYNHDSNSNPLKEKIKRQVSEIVAKLSKNMVDTGSPGTPSSDLFGSMSSCSDKLATQVSNDFSKQTETKAGQSPVLDNNIGSLPYAAPELIQACPRSADRKADIWALGVTIFVLVMLKLPFWHIYEPRLKLLILEGNWETDEWKKLIQDHAQLQNLEEVVKACLVNRKFRKSINEINDIMK